MQIIPLFDLKNILQDLEAHSKSAHVKAFQASQKERENLSLTVQLYTPVSI